MKTEVKHSAPVTVLDFIIAVKFHFVQKHPGGFKTPLGHLDRVQDRREIKTQSNNIP